MWREGVARRREAISLQSDLCIQQYTVKGELGVARFLVNYF
jgi:hypothetical protein